jgi:hypothetical protein
LLWVMADKTLSKYGSKNRKKRRKEAVKN